MSDPEIVGEVTDEFSLEPDEGPAGSDPVVLAWRAPIPSGTPTQDEIAGQ